MVKQFFMFGKYIIHFLITLRLIRNNKRNKEILNNSEDTICQYNNWGELIALNAFFQKIKD